MSSKIYNLAILVFENVEVLDFAGPFEAFSTTGAIENEHPFNVFLVAETTEIILARNGLRIAANYSLDDCPPIDILLVPGGPGTEKEIDNSRLIDWIRQQSSSASLVLSDCDGAVLLGKAGLLKGKKATTHHLDIERLRNCAPDAIIIPEARVIDNGNLIISARVSSGIDMSLYVISRLYGLDRAEETARLMEYNWSNRAVVR
jgi:transcriptional regulator GlxA family with amidase domain